MTEPILDRNADESAPLGSMFKLYVLFAVAQAIDEGQLTWEIDLTVAEHNRSLPSGELQDEPAGTEVTVREAATKMIQISDNTATDMLIQELGRDAIEEAVRTAGHHNPELMSPLPSTRELFQIGWSDPAYLAAWTEGNTDKQRALLDDLARKPIDEHDVSVGGDPLWPQGVEWFASPRDVAAVHVALQDTSDPNIREILRSSSGAESESGDYVAFKGGSSPGVLTGSWFVESAAGEAYVVVIQAATEEAAGISTTSQREFFNLADAALELATSDRE